jgi:hypothetical protein
VLAVLLTAPASLAASSDLRLEIERPPAVVHPLQVVTVTATGPGSVSVVDGRGREYVRVPAAGRVAFTAGGATGAHSVRLVDPAGRIAESVGFRLEAHTAI